MMSIKQYLSKKVRDRADYMHPCKIKIADKKDFVPLHNHRCQWNAYHAVKAGLAVPWLKW